MANGWWGDWRPSLPAHTGDLQATDLIECTSIIGGVPTNTAITGTQIINAASGGAAVWGGITGTLSAQTDLQTALDTKPTNKLTPIGTNVTGTTGSTISASALLPANTLQLGKPCMIHLKARGLRIGVSALGVITFGMYRNTSLSLTGGTFIGSNAITAGVKMIQFERHLFWDGVSKIGAVPGATLNSDMLNTLSYTETTINPAVNNYFIYYVTLANAGDTGQIQWGLHILYT
jgi:hypothetical protein